MQPDPRSVERAHHPDQEDHAPRPLGLARSVRRALLVAAAFVLVASLAPLAGVPAGASAPREFVVAPWGSDSAAGTPSAPFATISHGIRELSPGDTLTVRGGTYRERITTTPTPATSNQRITVQAHPGERPIIEGLLWLTGADYWTISGINVTWSDTNTSNEHMVKFRGGTGWRFTQAEVWGAKSYAAILVSSDARDFRLDHLYVHHTLAANDTNQDHLIYINNGQTGHGVIERNVLAHSVNGRGIKLGPSSLSKPGTSNITIRYNTFYANTGPSNIQLSGSSSNNTIHHNLLVRPGNGKRNITAWNLTGTDNIAHNNLGWESDGVNDDAITDGDGNAMVNPAFADPSKGDYRPTNTTATNYGAHANTTTTTAPTTPTTAPTTPTTTTTAPTSPAAQAPDGPGPSSTTPVGISPEPTEPSQPAPLTISPAPTGTDSQSAFVKAVVKDFLARDASTSEVSNWRQRLSNGVSREQVAKSFAFSDEWIGVLVDGYYSSTLGRGSDASGRLYWTRQIVAGVTPAMVASEFYASDEYFLRAGGTNRRWVEDLYRQILGRQSDIGGVQHWTDLAEKRSRSQVAHHFYQSAESRLDRVRSMYESLLGRTPDSSGGRHWVGVLANGRDVELATFLAASNEYLHRSQLRFG